MAANNTTGDPPNGYALPVPTGYYDGTWGYSPFTWSPPQPVYLPSPFVYLPPTYVVTINIAEPPQEEDNVRGLYSVWIVSPLSGGVHRFDIVATSEDKAKIQAFAASVYRAEDCDDYDVFCQRIGNVRDAAVVPTVNVHNAGGGIG